MPVGPPILNKLYAMRASNELGNKDFVYISNIGINTSEILIELENRIVFRPSDLVEEDSLPVPQIPQEILLPLLVPIRKDGLKQSGLRNAFNLVHAVNKKAGF